MWKTAFKYCFYLLFQYAVREVCLRIDVFACTMGHFELELDQSKPLLCSTMAIVIVGGIHMKKMWSVQIVNKFFPM